MTEDTINKAQQEIEDNANKSLVTINHSTNQKGEHTEVPEEELIKADGELTADMDPETTTTIDLIHCRIRSLEALNLYRFYKLVALNLRTNLIQSISEVEVLPAATIEELDFYDNRIKHISHNIKKLTNLKNLDLSFNRIKHLKNIAGLTNLENLYLVANEIETIEDNALVNLPKLTNLELGGNSLHKIQGLSALPSLEELWLGKNSIRRLENLQYLQNLRILSIQSNKLKKIQGLEQLSNLEELYLSHNFIEKIENLDKNLKLTTLDVTSNKLTRLENLSHLTELTDLWLSYNKIDMTFEEINKEIGHLNKLETIYLEGNPIQLKNPTSYRRKLILNLGTSLEKIDATYIKS
ncbi:related to Protein phosphatase 1 regulatory subunit SDS22 [Saccharomycodes ludwigii]|uniref:Related to Protein phosphatase 1 regulatory subunit SDS22 n=1 Tax=Saccharomycodes ludwigii TaxID=36035 RepID=A0A376B467_9ASCO|nr:related to Protein phosphatase 1 regulatory subunit SDS22 [Saccharomycodes ludwigii]